MALCPSDFPHMIFCGSIGVRLPRRASGVPAEERPYDAFLLLPGCCRCTSTLH